MGQVQSNLWRNKDANNNYQIFVALFGRPVHYNKKPHGNAIWDGSNFRGKTLFGSAVCFSNIQVIDSTTKPVLILNVKMQLNPSQEMILNKYKISVNNGVVSIQTSTIGSGIVWLKLITDYVSGKITGPQFTDSVAGIGSTIYPGMQTADPKTGYPASFLRPAYADACNNLKQINSENFTDDYMDGYISNNPLAIALVEQQDNQYYDTLDEYVLGRKNVSKDPKAYPRAPTGKPTVDNLYDIGQFKKEVEQMKNKMNPHCKGACADRYKKQVGSNRGLFGSPASTPHFGSENLIDFGAYSGYYNKKNVY